VRSQEQKYIEELYASHILDFIKTPYYTVQGYCIV
jgi:hypothetical protein